MNIYELFTRQVEQRPGAAALTEWRRDRPLTLSFRQLENATARAAAMLTASGLEAGDSVLVFVPMSVNLYVALLAIFRLRLVAVFLDPSAGRKHIARCCQASPPRALIATPKEHLLRFISRPSGAYRSPLPPAGCACRARGPGASGAGMHLAAGSLPATRTPRP